jgi:hypothetical protein
MPDRNATSCSDRPASNLNFSISRTRRIAILSVGITPPKRKSFSVEEALGPRRHMAGSNRNHWRDHSGMGGGIKSDWMAGSVRNLHSKGDLATWSGGPPKTSNASHWSERFSSPFFTANLVDGALTNSLVQCWFTAPQAPPRKSPAMALRSIAAPSASAMAPKRARTAQGAASDHSVTVS